MNFLSARELSSRIGGAVSSRTLLRWARAGHINNARQLASGRIVFLPEAVGEIITPIDHENHHDRNVAQRADASESGVIAGQLEIFG
ncbi:MULTISPECIES: hypothetical protein [Actinotignum]|uniref:hypothetical protein n=1 Tax=Actinotignum TaxID=1653174 RepID=UPI000B364B00|nr:MULTISPECIES: hypothetical protein [Actinotignum]MDY5127787.1 hypothetical protein [Actinotignum sp. SLA_B059]MDY5157627.1 hypothetical protein [Actinotignum timonense]